MIRAAGPADTAAVEAFLLRHVEGAMFPLNNLRAHGLGDGDFATDHAHAMRVWLVGPGLRGIVGVTRQGMVMPMLPENGDLAGLVAAMDGLDLTGAVGPAAQVRNVLDVLALTGRPTARDEDEPGFVLDLAALRVLLHAGARLITPRAEHRVLMVNWRAAYHAEVMGTPDPHVRAAADIDGYLARDSHRILLVEGEPVAMTGFNAILPEIVQIGGVYTPPALRNQGFGRLAVSLHLEEARRGGVRRAVLFAANAAAARAYQAIGFRPADPVALVLFDGVQRVGA